MMKLKDHAVFDALRRKLESLLEKKSRIEKNKNDITVSIGGVFFKFEADQKEYKKIFNFFKRS